MVSTSQDRRSGCRCTITPRNGAARAPTSTRRVNRADAPPRDRPSPETRNGYPHSSAKTVPENWVVKWVHRPSRVPGCCQAERRSWPACREGHRVVPAQGAGWGSRGRRARPGFLRRRSGRAAARNAEVQPDRCSSATNGTALSSWPTCPRMPVTWVITGTRRGGSQAVTSRSMLMNVTASPAPTSTRPTRASGTFGLTASSVWPSGHEGGAGGDQEARAEPVEQQPRRHLQAGIDDQLHHGEARQHAGRGLEPVGRLQAGHAERRALQHRDDVGRDADRPDEPRAAGGGHQAPSSRTPVGERHPQPGTDR